MRSSATEYVMSPPAEKVIPVTLGCDRAFTIKRTNEAGASVNYAAGTTVYMWIDLPSGTIKVDATVSGANAAFMITSTVCDAVLNNTRWRVVLDVGDLETPLLIGRFKRHDG